MNMYDTLIIESERREKSFLRWLGIVFLGAVLLCGVSWLSGCAQLDKAFDEDGNLTQYGQVVMGSAKGAVESVQSITPEPWSGIVGSVAGIGALLVLAGGKVYRLINPKTSSTSTAKV